MIVFFDIDDTLMDHSRAMRQGAMEFYRGFRDRLGDADSDRFLARWVQALEINYAKFLCGELSFQQQRRQRIRDIIPGPLSEKQTDEYFEVYASAYEKAWEAFPDVAPCLSALGAARLAIISNGAMEQQRRKLSALGIEQRFEAIVLSGEIGAAKPDAEIFNQACRQMGAAPGDCFHVGDQLQTDALGACRAGLKGIWLNRKGDPGDSREAAVISSLHELGPLLDTLS